MDTTGTLLCFSSLICPCLLSVSLRVADPGVLCYPACPPDVLAVLPTWQFGVSSPSPVSLVVSLCPHLLYLSRAPPPPGLESPVVVSAAPSLSPDVPAYSGVYRFSCWPNRCRWVSLVFPCPRHPSPLCLGRVSQDLRRTDQRYAS